MFVNKKGLQKGARIWQSMSAVCYFKLTQLLLFALESTRRTRDRLVSFSVAVDVTRSCCELVDTNSVSSADRHCSAYGSVNDTTENIRVVQQNKRPAQKGKTASCGALCVDFLFVSYETVILVHSTQACDKAACAGTDSKRFDWQVCSQDQCVSHTKCTEI